MDVTNVTTPSGIKIGFTFFEPPEEHLWLVASSVTQDEVVVFNFTTVRRYSDTSFVIEAGEHPFVTHKTCIPWQYAKLKPVANILRGIAQHAIEPHESLPESLMHRIWDGASKARALLPKKVRQVLLKQGFLGK